MCLCAHVSMTVYMNIYVCLCVLVYDSVLFVHLCEGISVCLCVCACLHEYISVYVCVLAFFSVCVGVCVFLCLIMSICI